MGSADRCRIKQCYGMTELGGSTHIAPEHGLDKPESIGPALPGVECRVVDNATGAEVGPGEPGELLIRCAAVMEGYRGNPAATAATIDAAAIPRMAMTMDAVTCRCSPASRTTSPVTGRRRASCRR
jgi:long-subunit acyl-CoA synthetase (AMP-forming)